MQIPNGVEDPSCEPSRIVETLCTDPANPLMTPPTTAAMSTSHNVYIHASRAINRIRLTVCRNFVKDTGKLGVRDAAQNRNC